ncbi:MAG: DegT/DnrJ/EryC1/StrS family aminotransferase [Bacteroidetes bacterium]|nr:DegT/DnrJ/EryC1/StrS family aminotransferase [Bacteroidota bacterium]
MINVTKTFLPPSEEYNEYLKKIWETHWVTNQGQLCEKLENDLKEFLGVKNLLLVSNGTIALQLAIKALDLKGEIITTPYSYAATVNSIIWENCRPVFCDIEDKTFCINPEKIEELITEKTSAILPTHVYGFPCDTDRIKKTADKNGLKVIYDGAHAFGVKLNDSSVFNHGDISTISFHATKLFHTIEGGAVITEDDKLAEKLFLYRAFGHLDDDYYSIGINARTSEFNAAMGLCNLPRVPGFISERKKINILYKNFLKDLPLVFPVIPDDIFYNYSYFPVFFRSEKEMISVKEILFENGINARRYFYPSLNRLPFINGPECPASEKSASCVLCLPVFNGMDEKIIETVSEIISRTIKS